MPFSRTIQISFSGGEISPEMYGRIDDGKYRSGLARCRNFIVRPQGAIENRPGTIFVREVKDSAKKVRLLSFTYSTTQTMVLECGAGYFRFHTNGATLMYPSAPAWATSTAYSVADLVTYGGVVYYCTTAHTSGTFSNDLAAGYWYAEPSTGEYEIPNPYAESDLFDIHYVQSADVVTLVHQNYAPRELRRLGATRWELRQITFGSPIQAPGAPTLTASGHTAVKYTYTYVVTAIASDGISESPPSPQSSVGSNLFETGATVTISWGAVSGASRYRVYKLSGGLFGYIGETSGLSIVDDNIAPDLSVTPPTYDAVFGAPGDYPGAVSYFEQRRCFAGTVNKPQNIWMTKSGTEATMSYSLPVRDDDRIAFRVAAREANTIRHIVPLSQLLLMTSSAEWRVTSVNSDAITPSSISVRPQSYVGASNVQPVIVNNTVIYVSSRGGRVRELAYNWQANGFVTGDLSVRASHLFDGRDIVDMAVAKTPEPIVWCVSDSGLLLGVTYMPEHGVGAWHWHDTDGVFESCAVVAEGRDDVLYCIVRRTVNGVTRRYVERMSPRRFDDQKDAYFVDCGGTYRGAPATVISGLSWLEAKTVSILADGAVHPRRVVSGGQITLDTPASVVHIGLQYNSDMQTLPVVAQIDASYGQGRVKNVNKVWLRVHRSSGIFVGPSESELVEVKQRTTEPYGVPPSLKSEEIDVVVKPSWQDGGQVYIRQADPLPLTVLGFSAEVVFGS